MKGKAESWWNEKSEIIQVESVRIDSAFWFFAYWCAAQEKKFSSMLHYNVPKN